MTHLPTASEPVHAVPPALPPERIEARTGLVLLGGFGAVLILAVVALLPVPYVVLRPGPAVNVLGSYRGKNLITITGERTYDTPGTLDLTTVTVSGGPGAALTLPEVIGAWLDRRAAVVPEEYVYPPGITIEQSTEENRELMSDSQEDAAAAALTELGYRVPASLSVQGVDPDLPAAGVLRNGDVLLDLEGRTIDSVATLRRTMAGVTAGDKVRLAYRRDGRRRDVRLATATGKDGGAVLGIGLGIDYRLPFPVKIAVDGIDGPSAGMMFALGVVDRLTPGDITGGKRIAGTGTIDGDGTVGPISGIRQKILGARSEGARYFLAPQENCDEVRGHVPDGMQVFATGTLAQSRRAVEGIAAGRTGGLPGC